MAINVLPWRQVDHGIPATDRLTLPQILFVGANIKIRVTVSDT